MTLRTERPPVRPRSGRRPLPPLIFLLVLAVAAAGVWWNVLRLEKQEDAEQAAACESIADTAPPTDIEPSEVTLRVLNSTDQAGLANEVATALQERGFVIDEIANDPSDREVTGVGELRHGARGSKAARFVQVYIPGIGAHQDVRADARVDVVIGPEFSSLASAEEVATALEQPTVAEAEC